MSKKIRFPYKTSKECRENEEAQLTDMFRQLVAEHNEFETKFFSTRYFVFSQSVYHFTSKKLTGDYEWHFGIWAKYDENNNIIGAYYIGEAEDWVDKFKPGRTEICTENWQDFIRQVKNIEKNPKQAIVDAYFDGNVSEFEDYLRRKRYTEECKEKIMAAAHKLIPETFKKIIPEIKGITVTEDEMCHIIMEGSIWVSPRIKRVDLYDRLCEVQEVYNSKMDEIIAWYDPEDEGLEYFGENFHIHTSFWGIEYSQEKMMRFGGKATIWALPKKFHKRNVMLRKAGAYFVKRT